MIDDSRQIRTFGPSIALQPKGTIAIIHKLWVGKLSSS